MNTFRFATMNADGMTLFLSLHTSEAPDDETWAQSMAETRRQHQAIGPRKLAFLVVSDGGAPSTVQRKQLADATQEAPYALAVVTTSPIARGAITAISWINPRIRAFAPSKWVEAVEYCGCRASSAPQVLAELRRLQRELGVPVACLDAARP